MVYSSSLSVFLYCSCDHRDLHVLTHSFPTRLSSDLISNYIQVAFLRCHITTPRSAVDFVNSQVLNHIQMAILSCPISTTRSEEHTSELQSLMRISYAVFCLKKKKNTQKTQQMITNNTNKDRI